MRSNEKSNISLSLHTQVRSCLFWVLVAVTWFSNAQINSSIDTTSVQIGEEIVFSVQIEADTTDIVTFPEGQTFLPLEVIESYKVDTTYEGNRMRLLKKYGLTQFDSGRYMVPKQKIFVGDKSFETDSMVVEIRDVAVDTTKQKMFEIKKAIDVDAPPLNFWTILFWGIGIIALLGILGYLFFRRKKRKEAEAQQLPPYEEAIVALKALDNSDLLTHHKSKEYYSTLTEIVKRYLDREVDDTALESTSDELIARLQLHKDAGHFEFDTETIKQLDEILRRADLVKFAKMHQAQGQAEADRNAIEHIINDTHESIPEPTEEELLENEMYLASLRNKRRKKRVVYGVLAGVIAIFITCGVFMSIYGVDYVKDTILGHPTKELAESRWIKSQYGNPAIVIETPKVLLRREVELTEEMKAEIKALSSFDYGSILSNFYILISTTEYVQPQEIDLAPTLESMLVALEQKGANNLIVKQEEFETGQGVKGLKGYGTFTAQLPNSSDRVEMNYQVIVFGQEGALQQVVLSSIADDRYAEEVTNRILNSLELEVTNPTPKKDTP